MKRFAFTVLLYYGDVARVETPRTFQTPKQFAEGCLRLYWPTPSRVIILRHQDGLPPKLAYDTAYPDEFKEAK